MEYNAIMVRIDASRQVGKLQHPEGQIDAERDQGEDQPGLDRAQKGNLAHGYNAASVIR